jgi:hypothetical protein
MTTLANINYDLNYTESTAAMVISNSPSMLEAIFHGLFIAARRQLGYNPNTSSFPFITRAYSKNSLKNSKYERECLAFSRQNHIVANPSCDKYKNKEVLTITLNGHIDQVREAIGIANQNVDKEDLLDFYDANVNKVYMSIIEDYWDNMVEFAKNNRYYDRRWQSIAA